MLSPRKSGKWLQSKRREQVEVAPGKLRIIYQAPKSSDAITASARRVIHILTTMSMHPHWSLAPRSVLCNAQNDSPGHKYKRRAVAQLFRAQAPGFHHDHLRHHCLHSCPNDIWRIFHGAKQGTAGYFLQKKLLEWYECSALSA